MSLIHAYISAHTARIVLAFLLFGSISGFVLGQELHHPFTPPARTAAIVMASAAGSLGTAHPTTASVAKVVSRTQPLAQTTTPRRSAPHHSVPHHPAPAKHGRHKHHHGENEDTISIAVSASSIGTVSVWQRHGDSGDDGGNTSGQNGSGGDD